MLTYCKFTTLSATRSALQDVSAQRMNLKCGKKVFMNIASGTVHISSESFVCCFAQRTSSLLETEWIGLMFVRYHPPLSISFILVSSFCSCRQYSYISLKSECFPWGNFRMEQAHCHSVKHAGTQVDPNYILFIMWLQGCSWMLISWSIINKFWMIDPTVFTWAWIFLLSFFPTHILVQNCAFVATLIEENLRVNHNFCMFLQ